MLLTRCPECDTTFRITADALRKADGRVRCGRCAGVFDAYMDLRRATHPAYGDDGVVRKVVEPPAALTHPNGDGDTEGATPGTPPQPDDDLAAAVPGALGASDESDLTPAMPGTLALPDGDEAATASSDQDATDTAFDTVSTASLLSTPSAATLRPARSAPPSAPPNTASLLSTKSNQDPADGDEPGFDGVTLANVIDELEASAADEAPASRSQATPPDERKATGTAAAIEAAEEASPPAASSTPEAGGSPAWVILDGEPPRRTRRAWAIGCAAASLLLALQVTHHYRAQLAAMAVVGPWVQNAYAFVGTNVAPHWDLRQYEILDWTAIAEPGATGQGSLKIAARIYNRGQHPQPHPHVQVQLKDRWEQTVGSRIFAPAEYLPSPPARNAMMRPGLTTRAELDIVDPGPDAYGFELDVCIPAAANTLRCAAEHVFR